MSVAHRVPPGWRQITIDLEAKIRVVDAYEDNDTGELVGRALIGSEDDKQYIHEAEERARSTCRECGKPGRLRGNRIVCQAHILGDPRKRIIRNSAKCLACGDEIESTLRQDFKRCTCGKLADDGGHEYLRHLFDPAARWQETSIEEDPDESA